MTSEDSGRNGHGTGVSGRGTEAVGRLPLMCTCVGRGDVCLCVSLRVCMCVLVCVYLYVSV